MRTRIVLIVLAALGLAGCAGQASLIEALAKDPATGRLTITTIYGTITVERTNVQSGVAVIDREGMRVDNRPQTSPAPTIR